MQTDLCRAAILAVDGCYASALAGLADVLQVANAHMRQHLGAAARRFSWRFVSARGQAVTACNGLPIACDGALGDDPADLVFVPGLYYHGRAAFEQQLAESAAERQWLASQWQQGAVLAANCTGTFLLAETGLLRGRPATTTWWLERLFRTRYPDVQLQPRAVLTEAERLCCAGASASWMLQAVRMVELFAGADIATRTARAMLIDTARSTQFPFLPLQLEAGHEDALVARAQHWLHRHLAEPVRLAMLADELAVSERTLIRRFKDALGLTPIAWLQTLRIDTARQLLEASELPVLAVAGQVGYQDGSAFTRLFREQTGMTPAAWRSRYRGARSARAAQDAFPDCG